MEDLDFADDIIHLTPKHMQHETKPVKNEASSVRLTLNIYQEIVTS